MRYIFTALLLLVPLVSCGQTGPGSCPTNTIVGNNGGGLTCLTGSQAGGVIGTSSTSVSNTDGTLTISPTTGSIVAGIALGHANSWPSTQTYSNVVITSITSAGTQCVQAGPSGILSGTGAGCGSSGTSGSAVTNVSNNDGTLTISPTTGAVIGSLALGHANTWTASQVLVNQSVLGSYLANNTVTNAQLAQMGQDTVKCNNTFATANASDCTTITISSYTTLTTSNWFSGNVPPVNISRLNDRLFVGGATAAAGANVSFEPDWYSTFQSGVAGFSGPGFIYNAQLASFTNATNANAGTAILAAAQSKNFTGTGNAIGITAVGINNNTSHVGTAFGIYTECHVKSGANFVACFGNESDPRDEIGSPQPDPYTQANVTAYQAACGAGDTSTGHPCGSAYQLVANPETYNVGINIEAGSVTAGAAGGNTAAIAMPAGYQIIWYSSAGTIVGSIGFDGSGNMVVIAGGCLKVNGTCVTVP